jgi:hypothetical protein
MMTRVGWPQVCESTTSSILDAVRDRRDRSGELAKSILSLQNNRLG